MLITEIVRFLNKLGFFEISLKILGRSKIISVLVHDVVDYSEHETLVSVDAVSATSLEEIIRYSSRLCEIKSLEEAIELFLNGKNQSKCIVSFTFDDGYIGQVKYALPILLEYHVKATFYPLYYNIENREMFWWDEVNYIVKHYSTKTPESISKNSEIIGFLKKTTLTERRRFLENLREKANISVPKKLVDRVIMKPNDIRYLVTKGMFIGGHSLSHPSLPKIPLEEARSEILYSLMKAREYSRKQNIFTFAYPFGEYNKKIAEMVRNLGFAAAVTTMSRASKLTLENMFKLGRLILSAGPELNHLVSFKYMASNMYYNYRTLKLKLRNLWSRKTKL